MDPKLALHIHDVMVQSRQTEEALIRMMRSGHGYFWIGGPGEEAFGVPLGLLVDKGSGPAHDYLHLHYRSSCTVMAMGTAPIDLLRQMRSTITDPFSGGRNFAGHLSIPQWNVVPGTSTIETQYVTALGTAWVQRRHGGTGISIVNGGDAGTAEGDFASCLNWSSRPGQELPILMIVTHNGIGISTPAAQVQNTPALHERAIPFGIRHGRVDGNDPQASWAALQEAMAYVRTERRPFLLQADVSRLYGHSSSSGARPEGGRDCLSEYEAKLADQGLLSPQQAAQIHERWREHLRDAVHQVLKEPMPTKDDVFTHIFYRAPD
jgi:2-oxoisovalerate dehydrogenase E1 component alpha subunit